MASGGSGKKVVGRLTIRVSPDMDGFREKVQSEAEAAAKGADPEVKVDADTTKARRKIADIEKDKYDARIDLDADTGKAKAKIAEATKPQRVNVKVDYDEGALDRVKKNIDRALTNEGLEIGKATQRLRELMRSRSGNMGELMDRARQEDVDRLYGPMFDKLENDFRAKVKLTLSESDLEEMRLRLRDENFKIKVKMDRDEASFVAIENRLKKAFDKIDGTPNRGPNFLQRMFGRAGNAASNFKFPDLVPNIGGLGGFGSIAIIVAGLSLLAPALAILSQALIGLPALVSAVALPLGVVALGFGGIKDALEASGLMDVFSPVSKKGKKGKEQKSPGEVIKDLMGNISDVFKTGLTPVFTQFAGILPKLTQGLPFVAQGLVKLTEGFGNAIASPAFLASFDRFTNSVGTMLTNMSPALNSFTTGMMNLIANVGDHLPGLGKVMTEWGGEFTSWVTRISTPKKMWGMDVPNSSDLDQAVSNMKPVLNSIKDFVGDLLSRGVDLAKDPNLINGIKEFMTGLEHLAEQVSRMGPVFENIATVLKMFPGAPATDPVRGIKIDPKDPAVKGVPFVNGQPYGVKPLDAAGVNAADKASSDAFWTKVRSAVPLLSVFTDTLPKLFSGAKDFFRGFDPTRIGQGEANAAPTPFNPGTRVGQAPVPVTVVPGANLATGTTPPPAVPQFQPPMDTGGTTTIKAPKIEAPKAPEGSDKIWEPLVQATQVAGSQVGQEVNSWAGVIAQALAGAAASAGSSGAAIGAAFAAGIESSTYRVQAAAVNLAAAAKSVFPNSPAEYGPLSGSGWDQVKNSGGAIASQFSDGLDGGFDGVLSSSKRLMDAVHGSMTEQGILPPQLTAAVKREGLAIGIELDRLKAQRDALDPKDKAGRAAIKSQMDQLRSLKDEFGLTGKESKYNSQYGGGEGPFTAQNVGSMISQQIANGLNGALGFGKANVSQLEQDLGMSGNGVVEQLGNYGIDFLSSGLNSMVQGFFGGGQGGSGNTYNFHTMDHDGMMQDYTRVKNREAMQYDQRNN